MISKEQYLQAKKTIADYELQECLSGNSGLACPVSGKTLTNVGGLWWETGPARGKTILEEAKERGYKNGAKVWFKDGSTMNLVGNPWMDDSKLLCGAIGYTGVTTSKITLWTPKYGWLVSLKEPAREEAKSPLQEAMDRGYRKGAVVEAGTEWTLTSDPYMEDGEVRCQSWLDGVESPVIIRIVNKDGEYTVKLIKAPESPVNNK